MRPNWKTPIYFLNLLLLMCLIAYGQKKYDYNYQTSNLEVKRINNDAAKTMFEVTGSYINGEKKLTTTENSLRTAITLNPDFKLSYLNLISCIELLNSLPYNNAPRKNLNALIEITNMWLNRHSADKDMLLKRGIYYEKNGNKSLSDKDYSAVLNYLNKIEFKVLPDMKPRVIEDYVSYAYLFVIVKQPSKGIKLIDELYDLFQNNSSVSISHKILHTTSREEIIYQFKIRLQGNSFSCPVAYNPYFLRIIQSYWACNNRDLLTNQSGWLAHSPSYLIACRLGI